MIRLAIALFVSSAVLCAAAQDPAAPEAGSAPAPASRNWMRFQAETFSCVVGNNEAGPDGHVKGYNGLWSLRPADGGKDLIDAGFSGLNLEHYFNGWDPDMSKDHMAIRYDPRYSGMTFQQVSETQCVLHQPPTAHFGVESWTTYTLVQPRYLDISFRCIPRKAMYPFDWMGVFWATYANEPSEKNIFFLGYQTPDQTEPRWMASSGSMYYSRAAQVPLRFQGPMVGHAMSLTASQRWAKPFYCGRWGSYVYVLMFETDNDVGFYAGQKESGWNPWDFQMIIRHPQVDAEYRLDMRLAFDRFTDPNAVLAEYEQWHRDMSARGN